MNWIMVPLIFVLLWVAVMSVDGYPGDIPQLKEQIPNANRLSQGHNQDAMNEIEMEFLLQDLLLGALETPFVDGMGLLGGDAFEEDFAATKNSKSPRDRKVEKLVKKLEKRQKKLSREKETPLPLTRDAAKKPLPADFMMVDIVFQEPYPAVQPQMGNNLLKRQVKYGGGKIGEEFVAKEMGLPALTSEMEFLEGKEKADIVARAMEADDTMRPNAPSRGSAHNNTDNGQFTNYGFALEDTFLFLSFCIILAGLLICARSVWNNLRYDSLDGQRRNKNGVSSRSCLMNPNECGQPHVKQLDYQFVV